MNKITGEIQNSYMPEKDEKILLNDFNEFFIEKVHNINVSIPFIPPQCSDTLNIYLSLLQWTVSQKRMKVNLEIVY